MKRCLALFSVILIGCLSFAACLQISLLQEKDNVTFVDRILYGDAATVEDLTVNVNGEYDGHLFWDITYEAGENPSVSTDYTFRAIEKEYEHRWAEGVFMDIDIQDYYFQEQAERSKMAGISQAIYDLYQETEYNETKTRTVKLKDYYEYYPLSLSINGENIDYHWNWNTIYDGEFSITEDPEYADYMFLKNFFRIPVIEDDTRTIEVSKSSGDLHYTSVYDSEEKDPYYFEAYGAITNDSILFTFALNLNEKETTFDTSLIPGGYGIYRIPCETEMKGDSPQTTANIQELSMAYSLDRDIRILGFEITKDKSKLLLTYLDQTEDSTRDSTVMKIIDTATMTELQTIILDGIPKEDGSTEILIPHDFYIYDDFVAIHCSGSYLVVLSLTGNGDYEQAFTINIQENPIFDYYLREPHETIMAWNGEQIAVAGHYLKEIGDYAFEESVGFYLAVFDKDGLVYLSEHSSSLDRSSYPAGGAYRTSYYYEEPFLELKWK